MDDLDPAVRPTVSIDEAARLLGIARTTAYAAARSGELPTLRFGGRIRVPTAELRRLLRIDQAAVPA